MDALVLFLSLTVVAAIIGGMVISRYKKKHPESSD